MAQAADGYFSGQSSNRYRGSLAFINHPNPVEPSSVSQRHPLDGVHQLSSTSSNQEIRRVLHDRLPAANSEERPSKRQKAAQHEESNIPAAATAVANSLDLPRLPVRQGTKRLRIPPTLSGLHHPPPNAGLLPSISTEKPAARETQNHLPPPRRTSTTHRRSKSPNKTSEPSATDSAPKPKRNKWTDDETVCLLQGVARFGIGNWTKILNCAEYSFSRRTALDLKDRFRVCCPQHYRKTRPVPGSKKSQESSLREHDQSGQSGGTEALAGSPAGPKSQQKTALDLHGMGIDAPFAPNNRRKRRGYSEEEDDALLRGFERHGNAWAAIRQDKQLCLEHRKPTDLRDRFRTRYPEKYAEAGLAPRPEVFPNPPDRGTGPQEKSKKTQKKTAGTRHDESESARPTLQTRKPTTEETFTPKRTSKPLHVSPPSDSQSSKPPLSGSKSSQLPPSTSFYSSYDDVFFGALADDVNEDASDPGERITLDRGILDWASESNTRTSALAHPGLVKTTQSELPTTFTAELPRHNTLGMSSSLTPSSNITSSARHPNDIPDIPRVRSQQQQQQPQPQVQHHSQLLPHPQLQHQLQPQQQQYPQTVTLPAISVSGGAALPSLASVTAGKPPGAEDNEQLELPSLVGFGALDNDGRTAGHFLGLDELLS